MYPKKSVTLIKAWLKHISKEQRWCILINADPDAMASAVALKRIIGDYTDNVDIYRINKVTRPDNLAMIRYLRLNINEWHSSYQKQYTHFAIVDSQPHHNKAFKEIPFSILIDHHPLPQPEHSVGEHRPLFCDIRPDIGATSTIMTGYLRMLRLRLSASLATALFLGIRTDTASFERSGSEADFFAYQWLAQRADHSLLRRIIRSEYLRDWLPAFSSAFKNLRNCKRFGVHVWIDDVHSADLLVSIADFFTKVHGMKWIAVSGQVGDTVVVIFRGDGSRDIGRFADACFYDIGSAGGHKSLGRAEFPSSAIPQDMTGDAFVFDRLQTRKLRPKK